MVQHTCPCGVVIEPTGMRGRPRKYCTTCRPVRVDLRRRSRASGSAERVVDCAMCGDQFESTSAVAKYCSDRCRNRSRYENSSKRIPCASCGKPSGWTIYRKGIDSGIVRCQSCRRSEIVHGSVKRGYRRGCRCDECRAAVAADMRAYVARRKADPTRAPLTPKRKTKVIHCLNCGVEFEARIDAAGYCSQQCNGEAQRSPSYRPGRKKQAFRISTAERMAIYERDGFCCQLCGDHLSLDTPRQDAKALTLDHIECQSWVLVPDHSPTNLRTCCRSCNAKRGNRADFEEAA